jgi:DNA topoisomerase 2-associated protein PAT1
MPKFQFVTEPFKPFSGSLTVDLTEDVELSNWVDQDVFENEEFQE